MAIIKDESSMGGLKHPPKVTKNLYYATLLMAGLLVCHPIKLSQAIFWNLE